MKIFIDGRVTVIDFGNVAFRIGILDWFITVILMIDVIYLSLT